MVKKRLRSTATKKNRDPLQHLPGRGYDCRIDLPASISSGLHREVVLQERWMSLLQAREYQGG